MPWRGHFTAAILSLVTLLPAAVFAAPSSDDPRIAWGRSQLRLALTEHGYLGDAVALEIRVDPESTLLPANARRAEGFAVSTSANRIAITGFDGAGALYGCLEAAERIRRDGEVSPDWSTSDAPAMTLRGPCLLLMKLGAYNFPVTPGEFPFFYDRELWIQWLDFMAARRFNFLTLWNGHPFAYFVRFDRFSEAQSGIDAAQIETNREMLHWLVGEAGRRNIRLLFEFYNIHTSVYFQQAHGLPDENRTPTPLLRDYTAYAVETFAREFPEIGYYITPGEALAPDHTDTWVNDVLIPAIRRGGARGPIWLRSWGIDLPRARKVAELNPDVWMERKFNVEMIADQRPDPANELWARLTGKFVVNIHMAANLEPFRWFAPDYIRTCVANSMNAGAGGLHLYPRKSWRWPLGSEPALPVVQWMRDRFWNIAWARYAWNPNRDPDAEHAWWADELGRHFGSTEAAQLLLAAQAAASDVLPGLQRLIWLGEDNHTVIAAGIRLAQLESAPGIPFLSLTDVAQRIPDYLDTIRRGKVPPSPTPSEFLDDVLAAASRGAALSAQFAKVATRHRDEANALRLDAEAIRLVVQYYQEKMQAAVARASADAPGRNVTREAFLQPLERSVVTFRQLGALLDPAYDSVSDVPAWNPARLKKVPYHWTDLVPLFERELEVYRTAFRPGGPPPSRDPRHPGLAGILYGDPGLKRVEAANPIATLDHDWTGPERGRNWSAEWRGFLIWPRDGAVTLRVRSDQSVRLEARGETVLDGAGLPGVREASIAAKRGEPVRVRLVYDHPGGEDAFLEVRWNDRPGEFTPIPAAALRHSAEDQEWVRSALALSEL